MRYIQISKRILQFDGKNQPKKFTHEMKKKNPLSVIALKGRKICLATKNLTLDSF